MWARNRILVDIKLVIYRSVCNLENHSLRLCHVIRHFLCSKTMLWMQMTCITRGGILALREWCRSRGDDIYLSFYSCSDSQFRKKNMKECCAQATKVLLASDQMFCPSVFLSRTLSLVIISLGHISTSYVSEVTLFVCPLLAYSRHGVFRSVTHLG